VIHEVDEALRRLLTERGVPAGGGELAFEAPTRDWAARLNGPTVDVFLYDLREDRDRRRTGLIEELDADGVVTGWRAPPRWYHLSYLVTAWTSRPTDEHRLLSQALAVLARTDVLAERWLTGSLAEQGLLVPLEAAGPMQEGRSTSDVWSALGGELKPAIDLRVTAPLAAEPTPAGPPVSEGLLAKVGDAAALPGRRLRYRDTPGNGAGDGFAAPRDLPPNRRRRTR
jgi:Pvc16 N-terminal domain